jgi:5-methylcytosine-specific restriction endonuclease McrA
VPNDTLQLAFDLVFHAPPERVCLHCGTDITEMRANAKYCTRYHKTLAGSKRHTARNPGYYDRYREQQNAHKQANKAEYNRRARDRQRKKYQEDPELRQRYREWWQKNKAKHVLYQVQRRARKLNNPGSVGVGEADWLRLVNRYQGCAYCGERTVKVEMDHVIPLSKGGRHAIGNVLPACTLCNRSKNARLLADWRLRR